MKCNKLFIGTVFLILTFGSCGRGFEHVLNSTTIESRMIINRLPSTILLRCFIRSKMIFLNVSLTVF
jgi:hypothetical protein